MIQTVLLDSILSKNSPNAHETYRCFHARPLLFDFSSQPSMMDEDPSSAEAVDEEAAFGDRITFAGTMMASAGAVQRVSCVAKHARVPQAHCDRTCGVPV